MAMLNFGNLIISTIGDFTTPTVSGHDQDLIRLDNAIFGNPTTGTWSQFFTGSPVGLANEDINGLWIDPTTTDLYLTVKDDFAFANQQIDADDIFVCTPTPTASGDNGTYRRCWDGDQRNYGSENLDAISMGLAPPT